MIGATELMLIAGIALLLFGGKKLPEMMRGLGRGVREFKEGMKEEVNSGKHSDCTDEETNDKNNNSIGGDNNDK